MGLLALPLVAAGAGTDPAAARNAVAADLAAQAPRGSYPRHWSGEQTYFTVIGADGSGTTGLLNTDGAIEVAREGFSLEPFLDAEGRFADWNAVQAVPALEQGYLPLPEVAWHWRGLVLHIGGFTAAAGGPALYARYRLENTRPAPVHARLLLAIRPFQVNPPWQSLNLTGGVAPIDGIRRDGRIVRVDRRGVIPLLPPDRFGAAPAAGLVESLRRGQFPGRPEIRDSGSLASAVLEYRLDLLPGGQREFVLAVPFGDPGRWLADQGGATLEGPDLGVLRHAEAAAHWASRLGQAELRLPPARRNLWDAARSNLAYILVQREGAAFHPGSRTYARTWIRDSALMASALLGMGHAEEVRRFLRWFAGFQFPDGRIPCCVDGRGADPTVENDSHGEFLFTLAEYQRHTGDTGLVRELWPAAARTVAAIDRLRRQRLTAAYEAPEQRAFRGLMPESISHEGYSARPVHAYWDDFWTLRGLDDAVFLAREAGVDPLAYERLRDQFRRDLAASVVATLERHRIAYAPASVELGDFDVNATAMAVNLGLAGVLPPAALTKSYDDYRDHVRKRRAGEIPWEAYTPYEIRNVEALVRLGRRGEALDLLDFLLEGQRPRAWNGWAEVVWRDPKVPKFIGDMPHAWIGAEFVRAVRSLLAYEDGGRLVLAAGVPGEWVSASEDIGVRQLPTPFGRLGYTLRRSGPDELRLKLEAGLVVPPGGIVLRPPGGRPIRGVTVNGRASADFSADQARVRTVPAEVVVRY